MPCLDGGRWMSTTLVSDVFNAEPRIVISSESEYSHKSFLATKPECLSSTGVSRHWARVFSQKIWAVTLPFLADVEQEAGHLSVGLGFPEVEFVAIVLAQRLWIDAGNPRNIRLRECRRPPSPRPGGVERDLACVRDGPFICRRCRRAQWRHQQTTCRRSQASPLLL